MPDWEWSLLWCRRFEWQIPHTLRTLAFAFEAHLLGGYAPLEASLPLTPFSSQSPWAACRPWK